MQYLTYVESLGFYGVKHKKVKAPELEVRGFTFERFDPEETRRTLGRSRAHTQNLFVFVVGRNRAVRVDTKKNVVLLGNSARALAAFMESVENVH